jgi:hypothetical protein
MQDPDPRLDLKISEKVGSGSEKIVPDPQQWKNVCDLTL